MDLYYETGDDAIKFSYYAGKLTLATKIKRKAQLDRTLEWKLVDFDWSKEVYEGFNSSFTWDCS